MDWGQFCQTLVQKYSGSQIQYFPTCIAGVHVTCIHTSDQIPFFFTGLKLSDGGFLIWQLHLFLWDFLVCVVQHLIISFVASCWSGPAPTIPRDRWCVKKFRTLPPSYKQTMFPVKRKEGEGKREGFEEGKGGKQLIEFLRLSCFQN